MCDHKEADTRMCVHIQHTLQKGAKNSTDSCHRHHSHFSRAFFLLQSIYPDLDYLVGIIYWTVFLNYYLNKTCQILVNKGAKSYHFITLSQGVKLHHKF